MIFLSRERIWALLIGSLAAALLIGLYACAPAVKIYQYDEQRDYQHVINSFKNKEDWYWLVDADPSEYPFEAVIKTRTPLGDYSHLHGQMQIKVLYDHNQFAGFVTYYKQSPLVGRLLFLDVNEKFRRKGFGEKLLAAATKDLFDMGVERIWLLTRTHNERALNLYKKAGFAVFARPERYVYLEKFKPGYEPIQKSVLPPEEADETVELPAEPKEIPMPVTQ
jgi:ribosomal protein S18 acetylase RimI-like enzyme